MTMGRSSSTFGAGGGGKAGTRECKPEEVMDGNNL